MEFQYASSLILEAHLPFVKEYRSEDNLSQAGNEGWFFEAVSETYLPLLEVLDRLENDRVSFRLGLSISPLLCHMLGDEHLLKKYLAHTDKQIEFGKQELERASRAANGSDLKKLVEMQYNKLLDRRITFTERYGANILKAIDSYRRKGKIELLASCATNAFLPFISYNAESTQAQFEVAVSGYRRHFGACPQGFWLPQLGWTPELEPFLSAYNFSYTVVDSHALLFGNSSPKKGCFYPVRTPGGTFIMARDYHSVQEIESIASDSIYMDNNRDAGYELAPENIGLFLSADGERRRTGYKYWSKNENALYNPKAASDRVMEYARSYLEKTVARLEEASKHMKEAPLSLYAHNADHFGRFWNEGPQFIEAIFRMASGYRDFQFLCPSEYICKQDLASLQISMPEFSSWGENGYAETWLDASNDWIYRHLARSMERMTELAERFPDDTGLKERALNQAAKEILLAQSSDWPALLYRQDSTEYARSQAENALRNFTTIYEALGSNYISTEWLTNLERRHNFFPNINYRIFCRKK